MKILLQAILLHLESNGLGVRGKTLFRGYMPAEVEVGSVVLVRTTIDEDPYTGIRKGSFQVVCRADTGDEAGDQAVAIKRVLRLKGVEIGGVRFKFIQPKHDPLVYPRSDGGQFEASVNYQFVADNWE